MRNNLTVVIPDKAEEDVVLIGDYIAKDNQSAAADLLKRFYADFDTLSEYPELGFKKKCFT